MTDYPDLTPEEQSFRDMPFANWQEALPFALRVGFGVARGARSYVDVQSVVSIRLWRADARGLPLGRNYVRTISANAVIDELRKMAKGSRRTGYVAASAFVDVDSVELPIEPDVDSAIDDARALATMPFAAQEMVRRLQRGMTITDIARERGVSPPAICYAFDKIRRDPASLKRVPRPAVSRA